jgi:glycosyltransferase involved in cell wall biosynthesis
VGNLYPPHHFGGYELLWHSAMEHLRAEGHEVLVLTTGFRHPSPDPVIPEGDYVRRDLHWYWQDHEWPRLSPAERVRLERHNGRVLEKAVAELRPDVVNWWAMGGMSLSLIERVRQAGLPSVGVVGDLWMLYAPRVDGWMRPLRRLGPLAPLAGRLAGVPARYSLREIDWLFMSDTTRRQATAEGLRLDHAEVAHPGVDPAFFTPGGERDWAWRLLYVGRLDERKGVDAAVEALAHLPEEATLTVLGSGDDRFLAELRELAARLGVEERVEFGLRPRDELPAAYTAADALLFPTRWEEPWGLVPLESMSAGTPVIATGTGGSAEFLRHEENALVVGRDAAPEDLARGVRRLVAEPELRRRLRAGGLETAARHTEAGYNARIAAALASAARA